MLACVLIVLHGMTGDDDLGVLVPAANRADWEYLDTVGLFATILAPRFRGIADLTFDELCAKVARTLPRRPGAPACELPRDGPTTGPFTVRAAVARARASTSITGFWPTNRAESQFGDTRAESFSFDERPSEEEGIGLVFWGQRTRHHLPHGIRETSPVTRTSARPGPGRGIHRSGRLGGSFGCRPRPGSNCHG